MPNGNENGFLDDLLGFFVPTRESPDIVGPPAPLPTTLQRGKEGFLLGVGGPVIAATGLARLGQNLLTDPIDSLEGAFAGLGDIPLGILGIGINTANAAAVGILGPGKFDAREALPESVRQAVPLIEPPKSEREAQQQLVNLDVALIPQIFERQMQLARGNVGEAIVRTGFELSRTGPILDTVFLDGLIDPSRRNLSAKQKLEILGQSIPIASAAGMAIGAGSATVRGVRAAKSAVFKKGLGKPEATKNVRQILTRKIGTKEVEIGQKTTPSQIAREIFEVETPEGRGTIRNFEDPKTLKVELDTPTPEGVGLIVDVPRETVRITPETIKEATGLKPGRLTTKSTIAREAAKIVERNGGDPRALLDDAVSNSNEALNRALADVVDESPEGLQTVQLISEAVDHGLAPELLVSDIVQATNVPHATAAKIIADDFRTMATQVQKNGSVLGQGFKSFEDLANRIALQNIDPTPLERFRAAKENFEANPWTNFHHDVLNRTQQAGMLIQPGGAWADLFAQVGAGLVNAAENAIANTGVGAAEVAARGMAKLQGKVRNPLDFGLIYADTLSDLNGAIQMTTRDLVPRTADFVKKFPGHLKWSKEATNALLRGEEPPPKPARTFSTPFDTIANIVKEVEGEFTRLSGAPTGDITTQLATVESTALLIDSIGKLGREGVLTPEGRAALGQTGKAAAEVVSNVALTLRRLFEIEQRRVFVANRMDANIKRRGFTPDEYLIEARREELPTFVIEDVMDAVDFARKNTFSFRPGRESFAGQFLQFFQAHPILYNVVTPFPTFLINKWSWILERTPLSLFKQSTRDALTGRKFDPAEINRLLREEGIDPISPEGIQRYKFIESQAKQGVAKEIAKMSMGGLLVTAGWALRQSAFRGPKWDLARKRAQEGDEQLPEEEKFLSLQRFDPLKIALMLGEMVGIADESNQAGGTLQEKTERFNLGVSQAFSKSDMTEMLFGIRNLDEESALALGDVLDAFGPTGEGLTEAVSVSFSRLIDTNLARFFAFLRPVKDIAGLTDMRAVGFTGEEELQVPLTDASKIGRTIAALPQDFNLSLAGDFAARDLLPKVADITRAEPLKRHMDFMRFMFGVTQKNLTNFGILMSQTATTTSDLLGQSLGDPVLNNLLSQKLAEKLQEEVDDGLGNKVKRVDLIVEDVQALGREFASLGDDPFTVNETKKQKIKDHVAPFRKRAKLEAVIEMLLDQPERTRSYFLQRVPKFDRIERGKIFDEGIKDPEFVLDLIELVQSQIEMDEQELAAQEQ